MKKPSITIMEFVKPAEDYENEMDAAFSEEAPKGRFSKPVINELVVAYRDVQRLMGFEGEDLYPMFEEQTVTEFPPQFVRALAMVAKAAEDYGQPGVVDLSGIKDDAAVATLAAKLKRLAADPGFADFLKSGGEDEMGDEGETTGEGGMDEMESMFASRA
jgi:hypothetical protein